MSIYDFTVQTQDGKAVPLSGYKGKVGEGRPRGL